MRRLLVPIVAVALLGAPAVAAARPEYCPQAVQDVRGTQPTREDIWRAMDDAALAHDVPVLLLRAIGAVESGWRQFASDGSPLISENDTVCGLGIMQVTADGTYTAEQQVRLAADYAYNVDQGAKILALKWDVSVSTKPPAGGEPDDPDVIENWYRAIHLYNGDSDGTTYPDRVVAALEDPFKNAPNLGLPWYPFTRPQEADPTYAYPSAFQAQYSPAQQFVFYDHDTGVVSKTVPAPTHDLDLVPLPVSGYGVSTYGPGDSTTTCEQCGGWRLEAGAGLIGRARWTNSVTGPAQSTMTWRPVLAATGRYRVAAYVPAIGADTLGTATYTVDGVPVTIDQNTAKNAWRPLGDHTLAPGDRIVLTDHSAVGGQKLAGDAVRVRAIPTLELRRGTHTVTYGTPTTLTIRLTHGGSAYGRTDYRAGLYKRRAGTTAWSYAGSYSLSEGEATVRVRPSANTEYQARFVSPDPYFESATSATARISVRPRITLSPALLSASPGEPVRYSIAVSPTHAGHRVAVQRRVDGVWRTFAAPVLSSTGRASFTVRPARGTYYYRVSKRADADHVAATSPTARLRVG